MTRRQTMRIAISSAIIAVQAVLLPPTGLAQNAAFTLTPIVKRGDPSPDGGRFFGCDDCEGGILGNRALNNRREVVITADTEGRCYDGRFLVSSSSRVLLLDFCEQTPFGKFSLSGRMNLNDEGQVAMRAGPVVNGRIVDMLFLYSDGQLTKIVAEGDQTPVGTIFKGCGFSEPSINNKGDVAFGSCSDDDHGLFRDGIFLFSGGEIRKVVADEDPSPIDGVFSLNFFPPIDPVINDNGEVLFGAGVIISPAVKEKFGLFLSTATSIKKIEVDGDRMPGSGQVKENTIGVGDLNNKGEVAFTVKLTGDQTDRGLFLYSDGLIKKLITAGDPTPIGGTFTLLVTQPGVEFPLAHLNNNSAVAFQASVANGTASSGIFLASPTAIVKVVATGDRLPSGETIRFIHSFALNDLGQVAFFAYKKKNKTQPLGLLVATPVTPQISSIKLKRKGGRLELRVNGNAMITNDTVIEIDGVALEATSYPAEFRENGGTTTRVVSRDPRLDELIPAGGSVQVTVFNPLTNRRSAPVPFTR